jgi:serine/threonine protein kinase
LAEPAQTEFLGTQRFQIVRRLGVGGMGVVYEAFDRERNLKVALKTLRNWTEDFFIRFKHEFRALQDIHHPNLVSLGELLEEGGQWFFTMQLIEGVELLKWLRGDEAAPKKVLQLDDPSRPILPVLDPSGPSDERSTQVQPLKDDDSSDLPTRDVPRSQLDSLAAASKKPPQPIADRRRIRPVFAQIARGLLALHDAQRVHRDIKPSNILVTPAGQVKILDFGLVTELKPRYDEGDRIVGTFNYMAPEQASPEPVGPEADWYAVGVILYQALAGRLPFAGPPPEVIARKRQFPPRAPSELARDVPKDLDRLCVDLLAIAPGLRPSGVEVLRRLQAAEDDAWNRDLISASTTFVGRSGELTALRDAFTGAQAGRTITVLLHGESGVGKSTVVRRFADSLGPLAQVFSGRCFERESVPYKAVDDLVDAISRHLGALPPAEVRSLLPPDAFLLGQVFPALRGITGEKTERITDPREQRTRTFEALRELLTRLAEQRPLLLVIDDLQWADPDSLELLAEVLRGPSLMLVATLRGELEGEGATLSLQQLEQFLRGEVRKLHLASLPPEDARQLVDQLLESAAQRHSDVGGEVIDATAIANEAKGHPLFIDELIRGRLFSNKGTGARPERLEDALWARIQRLSADEQRLLQLVTVAGAPISQEVAARAADRDFGPFAEEVSRLRAAHLVRTAGARRSDAVEAYHDRVRSAVIAQLAPGAKSDWHRRLALAMEAQEDSHSTVDAEALAAHWRGAGETAKAANYARRAADAAAAALAFERAARLYRFTLSLRTESDAETRRLQELLGDALTNAGRGREAAEAYLAAATGDGAASLHLRRRAADQLLRSGYIDEGLEVIDEVLRASGMRLPSSPTRALARLLGRRAQIRLRGLHFKERNEKDIDPEVLQRIDVCWSVAAGLGLVDNVRGSYFQTRGLILALRAGEPFRISRALASEACFSSSAGGPSHARTMMLLEEAEALSAKVNIPYAVAWTAGSGGIAATLEGRWRAAVQHCEKAEVIFREKCMGVAWELWMMRWFTLWSLAYGGELDELSRRVPLRIRDAEGRGDLNAVIGHSTGLANLVWLAADDPDEARRRGEDAMARWSRKTFHVEHWWNLIGQGHVELYRGDGAAALKRIHAGWPELKKSLLLMVQLTRLEATHLRARAALQAAAAAAPSDARALLAAAARDAKKIIGENMPWSTPLGRVLEAALAARRDDTDTAVRLLGEAQTGLNDAGMPLHAACARWQRGRLVGGDEGRGQVESAAAWMKDRRIQRPERIAAMLAPGFKE